MLLIGREKETQLLKACFSSKKPEFIALFGRRRVGKTFTIRQFFSRKKNAVFFNTTGSKDGSLKEQINHFMQQVGEAFFHGVVPKPGKNWDEAFKILTDAILSVPKNKKIVLFLDEFPWMATKNSRLLQNIDYYWNQHWSRDDRIKLIICGSSASWIIDKIVHNKGGLYNRVTQTIHLEPFNLRDTKRFLNKSGIKLTNKQIVQIYMVIGGIPYYLSKIKKGLSAIQSIEDLAFSKNSFLLDEFDKLFSSLFDEGEAYIDIVRTIASSHYGIRQEELFNNLEKTTKGSGGLSKLRALEKSDFIISFKPHFHKKKGIYYKVIDEYTLFYFSWIEPIKETLLKKGLRSGYWEQTKAKPAWRSWSGYAFEAICYKHLAQIGDALKLSPTAIPNTWSYVPRKGSKEQGAQIDLLFDRDDDAITLCEIKYTDKPFVIDKQYANNLQTKANVFQTKTKTTKQIFISMISANGIKPTMYSEELISGVVALNDLFK